MIRNKVKLWDRVEVALRIRYVQEDSLSYVYYLARLRLSLSHFRSLRYKPWRFLNIKQAGTPLKTGRSIWQRLFGLTAKSITKILFFRRSRKEKYHYVLGQKMEDNGKQPEDSFSFVIRSGGRYTFDASNRSSNSFFFAFRSGGRRNFVWWEWNIVRCGLTWNEITKIVIEVSYWRYPRAKKYPECWCLFSSVYVRYESFVLFCSL